MNKYWPKKWNDKLPNFLGEDFFSSFDFMENNNNNETEPANMNNNNSNIDPNNSSGIKVNLYEAENELLCIFRVPGLNLDDVIIDVYDRTLEVIGTVQIDHKGFRPIQLELYQGPVTRKVKLPYPARHDKIDAAYHHGYLYIRLHRLVRSKETKQKIKIHDLDVED